MVTERLSAAMLLTLLSVHFVADFVLQTNWQAQNKSRNWNALTRHVAVYSACFLPFGVRFAIVTFACHFLTDAVTSRINKRLWDAKRVHGFFVGVGADQLVHAWTLALTGWWLWA